MRRRRDRSRWTAVAAVIVVTGAGLLGLGVLLLREGAAAADPWSGVISAYVAVLVAAGSLIGWLRHRDAGTADPDAALRAARLERLAVRMNERRTAEEEQRRLLDPYPLPVSWHTLGPPASDHWSVIRQDGRDAPLSLDGTLDDLHQIVSDTVPTRRLLVLGGPGSGKTSLLIRLAGACLAARAADGEGPVPVILRLSTWNPSACGLRRWITEQVEQDYGVDGITWDESLLPLLDGLDEMPPDARGKALHEVNKTFAPGLPLVMTSRDDEYQEARRGSDVITGAAVIELDPLTPDAVLAYLRSATRADRGGAWKEVFDEVDREPHGLLSRTLATPLNLSLTRLTYADGPAHPGLLLRLPGPSALRGHLLDQLIHVLYPDPDPGERTWKRGDAHRWLTFLARHLHRRDAYDLPWWELAQTVPRRARVPIWAVTVAIVCGAANLVIGLPWSLTAPDPATVMRSDLLWGLGGGLLIGSVNSLWTPLFSRPPKLARCTVRRTGRPLPWRLCRGLGSGFRRALRDGVRTAVPVSVIISMIMVVQLPGESGVAELAGTLAVAYLYAFAFGFCCGFVYGLAVGFGAEFVTVLDNVDAGHARPDEVLRADRTWTALTALTGGLITAAITPVFMTEVVGDPADWRLLSEVAVRMGVIGALASSLGTASTQFLLARMALAAAGRMPWHAMAFLQDAAGRGALRQVGGTFQFRHALLRDRLVGADTAAGRLADDDLPTRAGPPGTPPSAGRGCRPCRRGPGGH